MSDQLDPAAFRAQADQLASGLKDLAPAVAAFWKQLIAEGMDRRAATELVLAWFLKAMFPGQP